MSTPNKEQYSKTDAEIRRAAIVASAVEQFQDLLEKNFDKIVKAAEVSFAGDYTKTEPVAKASFVVEWSALSASPKVHVKVGYGIRYTDESEADLDPLQGKLAGIAEGGK